MELDCIKFGFGPVCVELPNEPESIHFMQWLHHFPVVCVTKELWLQSGASSLAKHGGAYFSAVYGFIQDPIAAPGLFDIQVR